jgi:hypothetical protein
MAIGIDSEIEEFARGLFANCPFNVGTWNGKNRTPVNESRHISHYDGHLHVYTSIEACNVWNNYRCTRILVNSLLLSHLKCPTNHTVTSIERYPEDHQSVPFKFGLAGHGRNATKALKPSKQELDSLDYTIPSLCRCSGRWIPESSVCLGYEVFEYPWPIFLWVCYLNRRVWIRHCLTCRMDWYITCRHIHCE